MNEDGDGRRRSSRTRETYAACPCGGAWFELRGTDTTAHLPHGAVCLDPDGRVTGYAGTPYCTDCGQVWDPDRAHLRLVE